ncbi:MAG: formylglycine-generating enzyme family protein [Phycisphaeraceae bacterium]|nr:formylglycine-generating enzyme family protein [Phycisphaeraceae bacterium]
MDNRRMISSRTHRVRAANAGRSVVLWMLLIGVWAGALCAQDMTDVRYGNQKLGEETTVKDSLDDPGFKLRKLGPKHPLHFEQPKASASQVTELKALKAGQWTVPTTAMKMALVPAGEFVMGSPKEETFRSDSEVQHRVKISKPFYMGIYEVTQRQFYYLTIPDYNFKGWKFRRGPLHVGAAFNFRTALGWGKWLDDSIELELENPMECVSWVTAVKYCQRLTEFERHAGRLPQGYEYRLPTEAEWEYACRAGTKSCFNTDAALEGFLELEDSKLTELAHLGGLPDRVGADRTPNGLGLYDMHGNVSEWTLDTFAPYNPGFQVDPINLENEADQDVHINEKVIRGGSYQLFNPRLKPGEKIEDKKDEFYHFRTLRSASRNSIPFDFDFNMTTGFRIVLAQTVSSDTLRVKEGKLE